MKIGIFGGSFNPPHNGHIALAQSIQKKLGLEKVYIVPSNQSPLKEITDSPSGADRLAMTELAFSTYGEKFVVDGREIERGKKSFTLDTLKSFQTQMPDDEFFLILGEDQFESFDQWRDPKGLLKLADVVVASRPGHHFPSSLEEMPQSVQESAESFEFNKVHLKSGNTIQFVTIPEVAISSSELRKKLRTGQPVEKYLPLNVENYIRDRKLYRNLSEKIKDYGEFTAKCAQILDDKKAINIKALDLTQLSAPFEYVIITSGTSTKQASAMAQSLVQEIKQEYGVYPQGVEGMSEGRWVAIDYGSLAVHVFYDYVRQEYNLEEIWKSSPSLNWSPSKK